MDQMHEIDLDLNDLRNIYLLPARYGIARLRSHTIFCRSRSFCGF